NTHMVPTHFGRLLALPEETRQRYDISSMRWILHAAAPCPVGVKRAMLDWWGPRVYEYYAATEGGGTLATPEDWLAKPGTVGKPWPISEVMVADEDGAVPGPELIASILASLDGRLARMKWPKRIDFIEQMPRDPSGKLLKRRLRDPYWQDRDTAI